jgi:site-specific DNA-methyltransferase (adenine-specific)
VLRGLEADSVDACVCDPPYGIGFMGKQWDQPGSFVERKPQRSNRFDHVGGNHNPCNPQDAARTARVEGHKFQAWCEEWAREVYRVMKPGAHLVAFGGTRTYHRMVCAIEDAGFEIRDQIAWVFGSGFPKSHNIGKAIDRMAGAEREVIGTVRVRGGGTEHINRANAERHGYRPDGYQKGENVLDVTAPATPEAAAWEGWGTALKPAFEPIVLARKPLSEPTVAANVLRWGTGALNIDGCRVGTEEKWATKAHTIRGSILTHAGAENAASRADSMMRFKPDQQSHPAGRWPANLCHDSSEEVLLAFDLFDAPGQQGPISSSAPSAKFKNTYGKINREGEASANRRYTDRGSTNFAARPGQRRHDPGSPARFFYSAKASATDRAGSKHPTVKPVALMRWLVRMVTPPGGTVLDPFAGSGTTGEAALLEGFRAALIEQDPAYVADIRRRLGRPAGSGSPLFSETAA